MMDIRNFHLKSAFINFNSEDLNATSNNDTTNKSKGKSSKSLSKPSERVQTLMKNYKTNSKFCQGLNHPLKQRRPHITVFQFEPALTQQNKIKSKYLSCTLSPKKQALNLTSPYKLYKINSKDHKVHNLHKRRFSDTNVNKSFKNRVSSKQKPNPDPETDTQPNLNPAKQNDSQRKRISEQSNEVISTFNKTANKIKIFEIDNVFCWNPEQSIIHSNKNGSSFITTLPSKRKNFRTVKSSSLKDRNNEKSFSPQKSNNRNIPNDAMISSQTHEKIDDFKRSIHTAGSVTARRIDYDKLVFTPISTGFFPNSSIWNRQEQFVNHAQVKPRSYKVLEKSVNTKQTPIGKEEHCRPWSPSRPENLMLHLQDQEVFPEIKEH